MTAFHLLLFATIGWAPVLPLAVTLAPLHVSARILRSAEASEDQAKRHPPANIRRFSEKSADGRDQEVVIFDFE